MIETPTNALVGREPHPFEIGFWVGGSNTPNSTETSAGRVRADLASIPTWQQHAIEREPELTNSRRGDKAYVAARDAWNKLASCPFCGATTCLRRLPERHNRLAILCTGGDACDWGRLHSQADAPEPLPFLLADSDIYRRAPSVLLGTIDKLALLGQNVSTINRIAGMFGLARAIEGGPDGLLHTPDDPNAELPPACEPVAPAWAGGREVFFDPFPSLIVQDEMHLLDESLGTFGGVFETGLFAWFEHLSLLLQDRVVRTPGAPDRPRMPHVVGATATAADAQKHVGALYQKNTWQFPHPGPSLHGGFYASPATFTPGSDADRARTAIARVAGTHPRVAEAAAPWGRVYASVMTNGRLHTVTTLAVLAAHAATVTRWLRDLHSQEPDRQARAAAELMVNVSDSPWAERRRAAVERQRQEAGYAALATLVDLHRIALTYVTNKKGGDQILSAIGAEVNEAHEAMGTSYLLRDYRMQLISGGVDVKGIQAVVREAELPFARGLDESGELLRGIVATSAISHGVDVDAFNAMVFAGMPSDIAEYIQASSRVGRQHVGFSLLVPTPQARRDRFVVGTHEAFHRLLERMIAPPAIERWAERALERTIPSLVQTWLAGVWYQREFVGATGEAKLRLRVPATVEAVNEIFGGRRGPANADACVAFVREALGIVSAQGGAGASAKYYSDVVRRTVSELRDVLRSGRFTGRLAEFWDNGQNPMRRLRPMTSLRDVDETGLIHGAVRTMKNKPLESEELAGAMALLRNRGVSRGRAASHSELDGEG